MFIENKPYNTPSINDVSDLRYAMFRTFYSDANYIDKLKDIIVSEIDCLGIDYDSCTYTFTIKIKKTSMRRHYRFVNQPQFYYSIINKIFSRFISENIDILAANTTHIFADPRTAITELSNNSGEALSMLAHVSCISDNIVLIKL